VKNRRKCHDEDEEESSRPITIARLRMCSQNWSTCLGYARRGLSFDEFLCCFDGVFFTHYDGPDDGNDQGRCDTPKKTTLRFNVSMPKTTSLFAEGWFSALALEREAFRAEKLRCLASDLQGYNEEKRE